MYHFQKNTSSRICTCMSLSCRMQNCRLVVRSKQPLVILSRLPQERKKGEYEQRNYGLATYLHSLGLSQNPWPLAQPVRQIAEKRKGDMFTHDRQGRLWFVTPKYTWNNMQQLSWRMESHNAFCFHSLGPTAFCTFATCVCANQDSNNINFYCVLHIIATTPQC